MAKCPHCGSNGYQGLTSFECDTPGCQNFSGVKSEPVHVVYLDIPYPLGRLKSFSVKEFERYKRRSIMSLMGLEEGLLVDHKPSKGSCEFSKPEFVGKFPYPSKSISPHLESTSRLRDEEIFKLPARAYRLQARNEMAVAILSNLRPGFPTKK